MSFEGQTVEHNAVWHCKLRAFSFIFMVSVVPVGLLVQVVSLTDRCSGEVETLLCRVSRAWWAPLASWQ